MDESQVLPSGQPNRFEPFVQYGGWALACYEAGHDGNFDEKDSLSTKAFKVLQTLHTWSKPFAEFILFYQQNKREIDYLCSDTWYPDFVSMGTDLETTFLDACIFGHLQSAQWLNDKWPNVLDIGDIYYAFGLACDYGHLKIAQWLKTQWNHIELIDQESFFYACWYGHLELVKWMKDQLPRIDNCKYTGYDRCFRYACKNGNLEVAKWLKTQLPQINHRSNQDYAFRKACRFGHMKVAQWLKAEFPDIDHHARRNHAFRTRHGKIVKWLETLR